MLRESGLNPWNTEDGSRATLSCPEPGNQDTVSLSMGLESLCLGHRGPVIQGAAVHCTELLALTVSGSAGCGSNN